MNSPRPPIAHRGVTLPELLVVLAVLAIVTVAATPFLSSYGNRMKLAGFSEDLFAHLHLARSESIKRRGRVALCKSADGERCISTGGWDQGWIVFSDADNDGLRDPGEAIVQRMGALPQGWRLAGNASVSRYISYDPSGGTRMASGAFQAGTLTLCHIGTGPAEARQIILSAVGRPRMKTTTITSCV